MSNAAGSHLRFNPLSGEWILVAPKRGQRPQSEKDIPPARETIPQHDPNCYLCPGNVRASGIQNPPDYKAGYTFDNDFPALSPTEIALPPNHDPLIVGRPERGICRVMVYSPRHDLGPARLDIASLRAVIDGWAEQFETLGALPWIKHVQIFENHGPLAGASSAHPHSQIWAQSDVPHDPETEIKRQKTYLNAHGSCLLCDYAKLEASLGERVVCENDHFLVVAPYWAMWPFETMILPKRHFGALPQMTGAERDAYADIIKRLTSRYDNLFEAPFAYSMGLHQAPMDGDAHQEVHFHAHYYSPMKAASVQKIMAGYELAAGRERDDLPEDAATRLRAVSDVHYLDR
jgi:UDPglucose--hexose-1-phosphate uridylyltransferase